MTLVMFAIWVLGGLLAAGLAGFVLKAGGYGLVTDLILGVGGGLVVSWTFWILGVSPQAGMVVVAVVAFVGAAIPIVAQRKIWPLIA